MRKFRTDPASGRSIALGAPMNEQSHIPALKVLAVEDEALILLSIETLLAEASYAVSTASSAREALALLDVQSFQAAVLDLGLIDGTTFAVADALTTRKIPFVFCTASNVSIPLAYIDVPIVDKPFTDRQLLDAVGQVLLPR